MGLFDLKLWDKCLIMKQIWHICCKKDTLWVKWVHTNNLKGCSFWAAKIPVNGSWVCRKILLLREEAQLFIRHLIGNGADTYFWYDYWHPIGPLYKYFSENLLIAKASRVSRCIQGSMWKWPQGRRRTGEIKKLIRETPHLFLLNTHVSDEVYWYCSASSQLTTFYSAMSKL